MTKADPAWRPVLPHEEGDEGPRRTDAVAINQMQLLGALEPTGSLDKTQPEEADIEINVGLDPARDQRDVVDPRCHAALPADNISLGTYRTYAEGINVRQP